MKPKPIWKNQKNFLNSAGITKILAINAHKPLRVAAKALKVSPARAWALYHKYQITRTKGKV